MFQLQTPNNKFKHLDKCFRGYLGQRSPEVPQGHQGSRSVKHKKSKISYKLLNFRKN